MADALAQWQADLAQLTELDDGALQALETQLVDAFDAADSSGDDAAMTEIANALDTVRAEIAKRSSAPAPEPVAADGGDAGAAVVEEETVVPDDATTTETDETTEAAEAAEAEPDADAAEAATGEQVPDESADTTDDVAEEAAEKEPTETAAETDVNQQEASEEGTTVAAAAGTVAVPKGREPVTAAAQSIVVAGADIPGFPAGHEFISGAEFGKAMAARINSVLRMPGGGGEKVIVASIRSEAPAERILHFSEPEQTWDKIQEVVHIDSITAAGGCCSPLTTRYDLFDCGGVTDRPVRDALAGFQADRGGIRFYPSPALADVGGAVGFWTCADDEEVVTTPPGPTKACSRIDCPPEQTAEIQAVTLCLTFGVMQGRVFPELAVSNNKLAMVAHSRIAESSLLAQIKAGSKQIADAGTPLSATRDILDTIGRAAMYFRDRYRLNGRVPLRAIFPLWVLELLRGDIAWGEPVGSLRDSLSMSDSEIQSFFADRNINVTWALDSSDPASNGGGYFGNATTALPAWPTSVQWALFPEGSWLYLDGGSLDLGVVRDSGLVRTNDYMQFSEVFEAAANIGCESLWITSAVNVSGIYNCSCPVA